MINSELKLTLKHYVNFMCKEKPFEYFLKRESENHQSFIETLLDLYDEDIILPIINKIPTTPSEVDRFHKSLVALADICAARGYVNVLKTMVEKCPEMFFKIASKPPRSYPGLHGEGYFCALDEMVGFAKCCPEVLKITDKDGNNVCHMALKVDAIDMVRLLVKVDPTVLYSQNKEGKSVLDVATELYSEEDVEDLKDAANAVANGKTRVE